MKIKFKMKMRGAALEHLAANQPEPEDAKPLLRAMLTRAFLMLEVEVKVRGPRLTSPCSGKTAGCFLFAAPTGSGHSPADGLLLDSKW